MKIRTILPCLALALTCCRKAEPPKPIAQPAPPPPAQEQPRKRYEGTRVGQVLADLYILDDILISGPQMGGGAPPLGPVPIPVQDTARITVTLSNDTDRDIDLEGDWPYLFRVSVTDSSGWEVFDRSQSVEGLQGLPAGDVKKFKVTWPVRGLPLGSYTVTLRLGAGGEVTTRTRLW
jgi:hypothetical protein